MKTFLSTTIAIALFFSCGKKEEVHTPQQAELNSGIMEFTDGWVRPGNAGMMTAAYFTILNGTGVADSLLSISSNVTDDTQIHESYEEEGGMMGMRPVGLIPVDANSAVTLKPGGLHIMIIRPFEDVAEGDSVTFELNFQFAGDLVLTLPVQQPNN